MLNNGDSVSRVFSVGSIRLSARSPRGTHLLVVLGGGGVSLFRLLAGNNSQTEDAPV